MKRRMFYYAANFVIGLGLLGGVAAAGAAEPSTQGDDALANYVVMNKTDVGRSLVREIGDVKTVQGALRETFPDLAKFFGGRPTVLGSYEDQRDHSSAFVSFSAQLDGQAMKGFVTVKMREAGAVVFVVFGKENATREEWGKLTEGPGGDLKEQMGRVPLTAYAFADGTGTVGLAEGWTTNAQTESNLLITGPGDQKIRMALGGTVYMPGSAFARQGNFAMAPYSDDPATALGNIIRANSAVSQRNGGPEYVPERLIKVTPVPARNPGGHGAQITYDVAVNGQGDAKHYRVLIQFEISPYHNATGTWGYYIFLQLIAPPETFAKDLPVMMAQAFSLNEDAAAIAAKSRREIDAANRLAEAQRAANQKVAEAHYAYTRSVEEDEKIKMRSNADFDETIRGERTVEDTQTGEQTSVNLGDVHQMVDKLNEQEPDRYKEIPLRDELYPMPGHENDPDYLAR